MPPKVERLEQNLIDEYHPPIQVDNDLIESKVTKELLDEFLAASPAPRVVGVAPIYTLKGALSHIAVAVSTRVLVIKFHAKNKGASAYHGREILSAEILCNEDVTLVGFDLSKLAIALFTDQNLRILNGVDLQSACGSNREPLATIKFAAKDRADVFDENIKSVFSTIILQSNRVDNFALQAWVAQCIAGYEVMDERVKGAQRINTMGMEETVRPLAQRRILSHVRPGTSYIHHIPARREPPAGPPARRPHTRIFFRRRARPHRDRQERPLPDTSTKARGARDKFLIVFTLH